MRVFVTGASGFIGGHIARTLARGHAVHALARSDAAAARVASLGAVPVRGDLDTVGPDALAGCDAVVHAAAFVEEYGTREQFWQANVEGTSRVLAAAQGAGVRRFVHIGTEAALFDGGDLVDIDESAPYPTRPRYLYPETKAEAERRVLAAAGPGFHTASVRPRLVWGPEDRTILPAIRRMVASGGWAWLDGGRALTSTTHVATLVHGVERALVAGPPGQAWFVADDGVVTLRAFLTALAATEGLVLPDRSVPGWLARAAGAGAEAAWRLLGLRGAPPTTAFTAAMMSSTVTVRTERARRELGWAPVISREAGLGGLAEAARPAA